MKKHPLSKHKHVISYTACGDCFDSLKEALTLAVRTAELLMEEKELAVHTSETLGPLMKQLRLDLIRSNRMQLLNMYVTVMEGLAS